MVCPSNLLHGVIPGMPRTAEPTNQSSEREAALHFSIPHPITAPPFDALPLLLLRFPPFLASHCNVRCRLRRCKRIVVRSPEREARQGGRELRSYPVDVRHAPIWALSLSLSLLITFGMAVIVFGVLSELSMRWRK